MSKAFLSSVLRDGTEIINRAGIYFDRNSVVLTNTTKHILMDDTYPVADFTHNHSCTDTGTVYDFTYSRDYTGAEQLIWNFGPFAIPESSTNINPAGISFSQPGAYNITLIVDRNGCSDVITKKIEIESVSCGKNKVLICHNETNNPHAICINLNALPTHLAHGDCIGPCSASPDDKMFEQNPVITLSYDNNSNRLIIDTGGEHYLVDIYDQMGRLIYTHNINPLENKYLKLNNVSPGIYYGVVKTSNSQASIKIFKF